MNFSTKFPHVETLYRILMLTHDRTQFVELANKRSSLCKINIGVLQGFTLGSLLFLIYINDFNKSLSKLKSNHFADDTTPYIKIEPTVDTINLINDELTQV